MIIVRLTSGLGNQMFQYSFYRLMQERYPEIQVKMDLSWFNVYHEHNGYELERIFAREDNPGFGFAKAGVWDTARATGRIPPFVGGKAGPVFDKLRYYPNRLIRLYTEKRRAPYMIDQLKYGDQQALYQKLMNLDTEKDWYLSGFWIEEAYYRDRLPSLQRELCFDKLHMSAENREWINKITGSCSVSLHVRRGDYVGKYAGGFCVLGMDYYREAVLKAQELCKGKAEFFLFSDDPAFVEREFQWLSRKEIVSCNHGDESFRDMQLMSLCRHNILANSTFSVWAALLNVNPGHAVFYPRQYIPGRDNEQKSIPNWRRIG